MASAFRPSVTVPTAVALTLVLSVGGGVLAAGSASAAPAAAAATTTASSPATTSAATTAAASPTATTTSTPAPTLTTSAPSPTTTSTSVPTAPPTTAPPVTPKPVDDLTVTSPEDGDQLSSRSFVITGTAPIGTALAVHDNDDEIVARLTTTTTAFSIPVSFPDTANYEQYLRVSGYSGGKHLTDAYVDVYLSGPKAATPVITSPVSGSTVVGKAVPLAFGTFPATVTVTGTSDPGADILVLATDSADFYEGDLQGIGFTTAASDGTWSADVMVQFGKVYMSAQATPATDDEGNSPTAPSEDSTPLVVSVAAPAGYIAPPVITSPTYPDGDYAFFSSTKDASRLVGPASKLSESVSPREVLARLQAATPASISVALRSAPRSMIAKLSKALDSEAVIAEDEGDDDSGFTKAEFDEYLSELDSETVTDGIQVAGTPSVATPGKLGVEISGTGTPGTGIALYAALPSVALKYDYGLYTDIFTSTELAELRKFGITDSKPPVYDGKIVVAANGTWSATLPVDPGANFLEAFTVDASAATPRYSDVSAFVPVNVTGTPAVAVVPAADGDATPVVADGSASGAGDELAYTGSDSRGLLALALGALAGGSALVVAARRRRARP